MNELEIFVLVDNEGCYVACHDLDSCHEQANDDGLGVCRRLIRVTLHVPTPCPIEIEATLDAVEPAAASIKVS